MFELIEKSINSMREDIYYDGDENYIEPFLMAEEKATEEKKPKDDNKTEGDDVSAADMKKTMSDDNKDPGEEAGKEATDDVESEDAESEADKTNAFVEKMGKVYGMRKIYLRLNHILGFLYEQNLNKFDKITVLVEELMVMFKIVTDNIDQYDPKLKDIVQEYNKVLKFITHYVDNRLRGEDYYG